MLQNVEPQRGPPIAHATRHLQRLAELTVRGSVDAAGLKAAFSCAERPAACRFRRGRPATSFDRQRLDAGIAVLHGFRTTVSPVNIDLPSRPGIQSNSHLRLDAAASILSGGNALVTGSAYVHIVSLS
jgi:hypothetical protein